MDYKKIHDTLKYIGFTESEVRAYLALLRKEKCTPAEVGKLAGLSRVKAYDVLNSLEAKGGCVQLNTGRKLYEPTDPEILLKKAQESFVLEAGAFHQSHKEAGETLKKFYRNALKADDEIDYIRVMKDPVQILEELIRLISNSREEILLFAIDLALKKGIKKINKLVQDDLNKRYEVAFLEALKEREVKINILTGKRKPSVKPVRSTATHFKGYNNIDVRIIEEVPCKVMIVDKYEILIGLKGIYEGHYSLITFHLKDEGLAELLRTSFYSYFNNAPSVKDLDVDILLTEYRIVRLGEGKEKKVK
jgi:sugar-specific transcriptional regulator TrmB